MQVPFAELRTQFESIEGEVRQAVEEVLSSGWFVLGEQLKAFEREFASWVGAGEVVGVGSGTAALQLALQAVGVRPGEEVVTAANTCVPTAAGISAAGAIPALTDIDPSTFNMDPLTLEAAINERTAAIVPVHLYGHPCDMDPILEIAGTYGLPVVEDCAQAHGARYKGRPCGTLGTAAAFSFYPSKNLGAYGDGGAVVTDDAEVAERVRMLRNYGEQERYHHTVKGVNSRLDELQAAILRAKLPHLTAWNERRRELASMYRDMLSGADLELPEQAPWAHGVWHLFVVRSAARDQLRGYLAEAGIGTQLHYPVPIHLQKAYADLRLPPGSFPEAEQACDEVLSLPLYPELSEQALTYVCEQLTDWPGPV